LKRIDPESAGTPDRSACEEGSETLASMYLLFTTNALAFHHSMCSGKTWSDPEYPSIPD
jgi:hypothetical protein